MTAQEAFTFHRARAFRDPDEDRVEGVLWEDDPVEVVAIMAIAMSFQTPDEAWSNRTSPSGRAKLDELWCAKSPEGRQLYRRRAGVILQASGEVVAL